MNILPSNMKNKFFGRRENDIGPVPPIEVEAVGREFTATDETEQKIIARNALDVLIRGLHTAAGTVDSVYSNIFNPGEGALSPEKMGIMYSATTGLMDFCGSELGFPDAPGVVEEEDKLNQDQVIYLLTVLQERIDANTQKGGRDESLTIVIEMADVLSTSVDPNNPFYAGSEV